MNDLSAPDYQRLLTKLGACTEARCAADGKSFREVWTTCDRGDWLLWLSARIEIDRKTIVRAACDCARLSLKHIKAGETRPLKAIETAEAWCEGRATIDEVRAAAYAANAANAISAAYAANAAYAISAAYAAYAVYAVYAAAITTEITCAAHTAATYAAYGTEATYEVRAAVLKECAALVRERIAFDVVLVAALAATKGEK